MGRKEQIKDELQTIFKAELEIEGKYPDGSEVPAEIADESIKRKERAEELRTEYQTIVKGEEARKGISDIRDWFEQPKAGGFVFPEGQSNGKDGGHRENKGQGLPVGQQFLESEEWKRWAGAIVSGGHVTGGQFGSGPPIPVKGLLPPSRKDLVTGASSTSAGAFITTDRQPYVAIARRPLTIRDIVTVAQTDSDTVDFVRSSTETNNAAPVAEATATAGSSGVKPESAFIFEIVTTTVKTIAHWIPASRNALADASQMRSLIEDFLRYGLEEELEDQMVTGSGTGNNFAGIAETSGVQAQAWDTDFFTTTRKARTKVRTIGRATPNAYLLNPYDAERLDLFQDNEGRYYYGGPANSVDELRHWRLPVVESEAVTEGVGYVGDFTQFVLWEREGAVIRVSDSHLDFFIRNLIVVLAEMRAAFGCLRPAAIVEMDLVA